MIQVNKLIRYIFILSFFTISSSSFSQIIKFIELGPLELLPTLGEDAEAVVYFNAAYMNDTLKISVTGEDVPSFVVDKNFVVPASNTIVLDSVKVSFSPIGEREHLALLNFSIGDSVYSQLVLTGIINGAVTIESIAQSELPKNIKIVNGEVQVEVELPSSLHVYDTKGRKVMAMELLQGKNRISSLSKGYWIVRVANRTYKLKI